VVRETLTQSIISIYASCSGRHDVGQGNVNIFQHLVRSPMWR